MIMGNPASPADNSPRWSRLFGDSTGANSALDRLIRSRADELQRARADQSEPADLDTDALEPLRPA